MEESDFVLVACTETYLRRFKGQEAPQIGLGGIWEGHIITQELYNAQGRNTKFIPITFCQKDVRFVPAPLQSATYYQLFHNYDQLYRRLTNQPLISMPALGSIKSMPARGPLPPLPNLERKQDFTTNETAAIARRLGDLLNTLGNCRSYDLIPPPTIAHIAERLGFESTAPMDELLRGDRPLSFKQADEICALFGVNRRWLLEGSEHRFGMAPIFREPFQLLEAVVLDQLKWGNDGRYEELIFILPPTDMYQTCVFGQQDESGYRIDLLLDSAPLYGDTGGTGQRRLFDFCVLAAALSPEAFLEGMLEIPSSSSYISTTPEEHSALMWGDLHVSCSRRNLTQSTWLNDIWDLEYTSSHEYYPQAWRDAYRDFKIIAEYKHHITNNQQLFDFLQSKVDEIRIRAPKP